MKFPWFRRKQREEELDAEIRSHLDEAIRDRIARGEASNEARVNALREFGNVGLIKEVTRAMWGWGTLERLAQDLRFGLRMLRKNPGFTAVAIITLALGIGANTAMFSVVNAVLLRPLPYPEAERLVTLVGERTPFGRQAALSPAEFAEVRTQTKAFTEIAAYTGAPFNLTGGDQPVRVRGLTASAGLFRVLGVAPLLGRAFSDAENQPGAAPVVVLSHELWRSRFNADAGIVGKAIKLDGESFHVIGVMPAAFRFLQPAEVITPVVIDPTARRNAFLRVIGRLRPEAASSQAQVELEVIAARLQAADSRRQRLDTTLVPLGEIVVEDSRRALLVLLATVGCVLLIACVNLANLLLARAAVRRREFAVRAALGAGRFRMLRQLLTESLLLALLGGAGGLLLAGWLVKALPLLAPESLPRLNAIGLDARVLTFTVCVSLLTGVLFGLVPAWQATRLELTETLKDGGPVAGGRSFSLKQLLVVSEIALSLVLLIGAGLLLNSLARLLRVERGFDAERVLTVDVPLPETYRTLEQIVSFHDRALERLRALPGVAAAGTVNLLPLGGMLMRGDFIIEGRPPLSDDARRETFVFKPAISVDYFRTLGIPLRRGRDFNARDTASAPGVVIISESVARRFFAGEEPLGRRISFDQDARQQPIWLEIVGVAGDVKQQSLDSDIHPTIYAPYTQTRRAFMLRDVSFVLRSPLEPAALATAVRQQIQALDGELPIARVHTMQQLVAESVSGQTFNAALIGIFALLALALASVGMYGVMAYHVAARTREIGVRMALGAQVGAIIRLIVTQGMKLALCGIALGLIGALALTRFLKGLLFDLSATDPLTFATVAFVLLGAALLACWIPARRAARVDPLIALRHD
jgi:putative ABC transport system permease protein